MNDETSLNELRRVLLENNDFVIAAHVNPDSDAVGSCLALGLALKKINKRVHVILDPYHEKNRIIPGQELIWKETSAGPPASVFIVLDCASSERVSDRFGYMGRVPIIMCIDHHLSHSHFARYLYLDADASSTCELIYRLISPIIDLDTDIASAIYAGLLTDTGGFRHGSASAETMLITAELIRRGIPFTSIYNALLRRHCLTETLVMRTALNNMKLLHNNRIAFSFISAEEMDEINAEVTDTDGVSEYLLNITDVEASVFLYEKVKGEVKASMRSAKVNLSEIAAAFGGGGHKHAAGCTIYASLQEAYEKLSAAVCGALDAV